MGKKKQEPMTEEERLAFEEQQRLLEEETRKKKESILSQFLKDKLMHEEAATRYNMCKLNIMWREIMKGAKVKELKTDMAILGQTFERVIDCKDAMIKALSKEILEADEMYSMAFRSHLQIVDKLLVLHVKQLESMNYQYCLELEMICEEFDIERAIIIEQHNAEMNNIDDISYAMDKANEDEENDARAAFESLEVELKNKSIETKQALKSELESRIEDLWQQFRHTLQAYNDTNEEKKLTFDVLKLKDDKCSKEVETNMRKMKRLDRKITTLQIKLSDQVNLRPDTYHDDEEDDEFNKAERVRLIRHFHQVKAAMNQIRDNEREKLIRLTATSNSTIKQLKKRIDKGVILLKLAELCRKLETEEEKVTPFYKSSLTAEDEEDIQSMESRHSMEKSQSLQVEEIIPDCSGLQNFWKRYNKVLLDKLSIEKEVQSMTDENFNLRTLLKQYLDEISVNDDVMHQKNPLLIINNSASLKGSHCRQQSCKRSTGTAPTQETSDVRPCLI